MADVRRHRKPIAVWVMLQDGSAWLFDTHATVDAALRTARTLCGPTTLRPERVWITTRDAPAHRRLERA